MPSGGRAGSRGECNGSGQSFAWVAVGGAVKSYFSNCLPLAGPGAGKSFFFTCNAVARIPAARGFPNKVGARKVASKI